MLFLSIVMLVSMAGYTKPKITKYTDHWGIFGGFDRASVCKEYESGPDGPVLVSAHISCTGSGETDCPSKSSVTGAVLNVVTLEELEMTEPEFNLAVELMTEAEVNLDNGINNGEITRSVTISKPDGTVEVCVYKATWNTNAVGNVLIEVQKQ